VDTVKLTMMDSNVIIFSNVENYPEHKAAVTKIEELAKNNKLVVNLIIVSEVFHKLFRILSLEEAYKRTSALLESETVCYTLNFATFIDFF